MGKFESPKNPALNYVSTPEPEKTIATENKVMEKEIVYIEIERERKTRNKGLLMKPSVHDKLLALSKENGQSFNDLANMIFEEYIKTHS